MIAVHVREINQKEGEGYLLGEFKTGELKALVSLFQSYPTHAIDDEGKAVECKLSSAHFVSGSDGAFFEIVVAAAS